ncbi:hypothetical protein AB0903_12370 [Streptomyces sp. NPDC048389]
MALRGIDDGAAKAAQADGAARAANTSARVAANAAARAGRLRDGH